MAERRGKLAGTLSSVFQANGMLITIAICATVILGGITLIESPANWWIPLALVAAVTILVFLLINARIVVKSSISVLILLLSAGFGFQLGATMDPNGSGAFIWLFGAFVAYFGSLAVSYLIPSGQSRWSVLIFVEILYFFAVAVLGLSGLLVSAVAAATALTSIAVFFLVFRFGARSRTASEAMPKHHYSDDFEEGVRRAAEYSNLNIRPSEYAEERSFLVWDDRSYLLYPVELEQAFGVIGRRHSQLSYKGKSINPWLRSLAFSYPPRRKARGADILLILVDVNNKNGSDFKTIGVTVPDSKAVVPVGIMPGKLLRSDDEPALRKALSKLDSHFKDHVDDLTPKQKQALNDFGDAKLETEESHA